MVRNYLIGSQVLWTREVRERQSEGKATAQMANCAWQHLLNETTNYIGL